MIRFAWLVAMLFFYQPFVLANETSIEKQSLPKISKPLTLLVGLNTYHFSENPEHNNNNDIIGLLYNKWFLTRYTNSHKGTSWGMGRTLGNWQYSPSNARAIHFGSRIWAGAATGYGDRLKIHYGPLTFAVIPEFNATVDIAPKWSTGLSGLYIWTDAGGVWVNGLQISYHF